MAVALQGARVLVTGGSGMIGSHVVDRLIAEGAGQVIAVDRVISEQNLAGALASGRVQAATVDVRDRAAMSALVQGCDAIVHLASLLQLEAGQDPRAALDVNVVASHDLLQLAVEHKVKRLVFASSTSVHGFPLDDRLITENSPLEGRTFYAVGKIAVECYCRAFADTYGLNYIVLRFATVYGPRGSDRQGTERLFLAALDQIDRGEVPVIERHPEEVRELVYVGDVAEAVARAVAAEARDVAVNIVAGVPVSIGQVYDALLEAYGAPNNIRWQPKSPRVFRRRFGGELAEQLLGFRARTSLADGMRALVGWRNSGRSNP